jgi:hypothetical protein
MDFLAAVLIAVLSAFLGGWFSNLYTRRNTKRETRRRIVREAITLVDQVIADLIELHAARREDDKMLIANRRASLKRLQGLGAALEFEAFQFFKDRRVRAGLHKTFDRIEKSQEWVLKTDQPTPHDLEIATNWIYEQLANTANHAAREAKLELIDPGGIKFIGLRFGIARRKYLQDLSFNDEIPPWQFDIKYDFRKGSFSQDEMRAAKEAHIRKAGSMRCGTHGYAAHIRLHGDPSNFSVQIEGCCKEFGEKVHNRLCGK